jgi:cell division protein FtsW
MREFLASQKFFIGLVIGLAFFGLIVLLSASGPVSYANYSDPLYFVRRQIILGLLPGAIAFLVLSRLDYRLLKKFAFPALLASLGLLVLVFIPGIGLTLGGSSSWVSIAGISFQPSEFVKITFLIYAAAWLASRGREGIRSPEGTSAFLLALGAVILLLVLQPDTGSMSVIAGTTILMYLAAGGPVLWVLGLLLTGVAGLAILIQLTPYRAARFMTFLHPELDPQGVGYHINQAFLAIGSGGLFGLGFGQSRQKYLYLPEVQGDSIFAVMAEELGFLMVALFIAAITLLVWHCFQVARNTHDPFGRFVAMGVGIWVAVQTTINIGSMVGLMPMTGVTLPFVSYGNSSTLSLFAALGIVLSVARHSHKRS